MRLFTIEEANNLLPVIRPLLGRLRRMTITVTAHRDDALAAAKADGGGGMVGGPQYVDCLFEIGETAAKLSRLGVQIKDNTRGLIDLPTLRDDRIVLLCWQLGETEEITWWHEENAGFAGRQKL